MTLFLENKYTKTYYAIINRAKSRRIDSYKERHHIIPQSIGGSNLVENIASVPQV